uniref:Uncharacterized protein n=1 Tax=Lotharella oceanica TaxID=641309 RepID=A0A7S2X8W2_9EUKA|mmetsp:Transcript_20748/g.38999  ORF Transcript_20748/g.38999 Transcript_20748/m.38999 type:complete len:101 (+) Transcript_20748:57-359(+)
MMVNLPTNWNEPPAIELVCALEDRTSWRSKTITAARFKLVALGLLGVLLPDSDASHPARLEENPGSHHRHRWRCEVRQTTTLDVGFFFEISISTDFLDFN